MAITLWTLAGTGPEREPKADTPQVGRATEEGSEPKADTPQVGGATEEGSEPGETGAESAEEKSEPYEAEKVEVEDKVCLGLLSSNIHIQILYTDLYKFLWRTSWENLFKDQRIFT